MSPPDPSITATSAENINFQTKLNTVIVTPDPKKLVETLPSSEFTPQGTVSKEDRRGSLKETGDFSALSTSQKEEEKKKLAERLQRRPSKFDLKLRNIIRVDSNESISDKSTDVPKSFEDKTKKLKSCLKRRPPPLELVEKNILKDVPGVANSLKSATVSLQKAQLVDNLNHLLAQRPSPEEMPSRIIQFEEYVQVAETFMKQEYNRQPDTNATFRKLTPKMKMEIRAELNDFKKNEMEVHNESLQNTSFH